MPDRRRDDTAAIRSLSASAILFIFIIIKEFIRHHLLENNSDNEFIYAVPKKEKQGHERGRRTKLLNISKNLKDNTFNNTDILIQELFLTLLKQKLLANWKNPLSPFLLKFELLIK